MSDPQLLPNPKLTGCYTEKENVSEDERGNVTRTKVTCSLITGVVNLSGRIYPREVFERALAAYQGLIDKDAAFGTLAPESRDGRIRLSDVSHKVTKVVHLDNAVEIELQTLPTHRGAAVDALVKDCATSRVPLGNYLTLGMSALGDDHDGRVREDLHIISFDFIWAPRYEVPKK